MILVGAFIAQPLRGRFSPPSDVIENRENLSVEKDRFLGLLLDLDQDLATGKIESDDYENLRRDLVARVARVIRELDSAATEPEGRPLGHGKSGPRAGELTRCPACGRSVPRGDRFCSQCGSPIPLAEE
jgi:hypothetical protein